MKPQRLNKENAYLEHSARMGRKAMDRRVPPQAIRNQFVPHPATFVPPADHKQRDGHLKGIALRFEISVTEAAELVGMKHGRRPEDPAITQRARGSRTPYAPDKAQISNRRRKRDSEEGVRLAVEADGRYRDNVKAQAGLTGRQLIDLERERRFPALDRNARLRAEKKRLAHNARSKASKAAKRAQMTSGELLAG